MERAECVFFEGREYQITPVWSAKRRTVGITVKTDGTVLLRMPAGYPLEEALAFAQTKAAWIAKHTERFSAREVPHRKYAEGEIIPFFGRTYTIRRKAGSTVRASFSGDELVLTVPADFSDDEAEDACRAAVIYLFRREGTAVLKPFAEKYAKQCGVAVPALRVRVQERKWGCCTPKTGIIINVKMMLAPQFAAEYLIVHEVAHLKHRNHQAGFWAEVKRLMPEYEKAEAVLKKDGWLWEF
ncbi:MAG TPA: SprT family zinc-dependent metalloprotease [Methanocorpusculum sp.]|nr:SprT family zinc-dependent metalloprotease [Methanocorpusculum sp.]